MINQNSNQSSNSKQPNPNPILDALGLIQVKADLAIEQRPWLVHELWPEQGIGFIGGHPKVGKTWLSIDLAVAVSVGGNFLERPVSSPGNVLLFLGEDYSGDALERIDVLLAGRGLNRDALKGRLYISDWTPCLEDKKAREDIAKAVEALRPALVIFDPLARFLRVANENSATEMRLLTNWLRQDLSRRGKVAVCICHHTDKQGEGLRGTGDLRALSEVTLLLCKSRKAVEVDVEMRSAKEPDPFHIRLETTGTGTVWQVTEGLRGEVALAGRALAILREKGEAGVSTDTASKLLGVRWDTARKALIDAGAIQLTPKGRWFLREYAPSGEGSSQDREECASAESSDQSVEREECEPNADNGSELDSSEPREDLGSGPNSLFPPEGGLREPSGEGLGGAGS